MEPLFLDSAFVISLPFKADQYYARAQATWTGVTAARRSFVTTTFILDEAVTILNGRGEHALAVEIGNQFLTSPAIDMVDVDRALVKQAWTYFVNHSDKTYSFTDCISFVVMKQLAIFEALTFDAHFRQARLQMIP